MKYRTYTRLLALALSLTLLTACGPKGESGSQSNPDGSVSSSQGSVTTPDASSPTSPCLSPPSPMPLSPTRPSRTRIRGTAPSPRWRSQR